MNVQIKYFLHRFHYLIVSIIILLVAILSFVFYRNGEDWKILLPFIGGAISLIYIIEKQQLDETLLFKQLFNEFNSKYDKLNEKLNAIRTDNSTVLTDTQKSELYDYFNLCGEEYLFYKNGYIYPEVWESWVNGMAIFYKVDKIKDEWEREIRTNSYYGLNVGNEIEIYLKRKKR